MFITVAKTKYYIQDISQKWEERGVKWSIVSEHMRCLHVDSLLPLRAKLTDDGWRLMYGWWTVGTSACVTHSSANNSAQLTAHWSSSVCSVSASCCCIWYRPTSGASTRRKATVKCARRSPCTASGPSGRCGRGSPSCSSLVSFHWRCSLSTHLSSPRPVVWQSSSTSSFQLQSVPPTTAAEPNTARLDRQQPPSCYWQCRSISSPWRFRSPSSTPSSSAFPKATRRPTLWPTPRGRTTSPTGQYVPWCKRSECHTTPATSSSTSPPARSSAQSCGACLPPDVARQPRPEVQCTVATMPLSTRTWTSAGSRRGYSLTQWPRNSSYCRLKLFVDDSKQWSCCKDILFARPFVLIAHLFHGVSVFCIDIARTHEE